MGIQISSLPVGASASSSAFATVTSPAQNELVKEKLPPLPMEQKVSSGQDSYIPGIQKIQEYAEKSAEKSLLKQTASDLEQISLAFNRRLKFIVDQDSKEIIIKVIDNETDKVIKVLPPEELQLLHSRIKETIGFLFDRMV